MSLNSTSSGSLSSAHASKRFPSSRSSTSTFPVMQRDTVFSPKSAFTRHDSFSSVSSRVLWEDQPTPSPIEPKRSDDWIAPEHFNAKDLAYIRKQIAKSRYGLAWNWQDKKSPRRLSADEDGITLNNQYVADKRQGDCRGLSIQMSRKLAAHFKDRYKFYVAVNNRTQAWENHSFLLAWPSSQDEAIKEKAGWDRDIPEGALIIDPSFGWMEPKGKPMQNANLADYSLMIPVVLLKEGSELNANQTITMKFDRRGCTPWLPLGYLHQLDPKFKPKSDQAFALIGFKRDPQSLRTKLVLRIDDAAYRHTEEPRIFHRWRDVAHAGSPLYKALSNMENALQTETQDANPDTGSSGTLGCLDTLLARIMPSHQRKEAAAEQSDTKKNRLESA